MDFLARIQKILVLSPAQCGRWYGPSCALIGACLATVVWAAAVGFSRPQANAPPATIVAIIQADGQPPEVLPPALAAGRLTEQFMLGAEVESCAHDEPLIADEDSCCDGFCPLHQRDDYRVEAPDILHIEVGCDGAGDRDLAESLTTEYLVSPDGVIDLGAPLGSVPVAGKTLREIEDALEHCLDGAVCQPCVNASVFAQNSHVFYVISEQPSGGDCVHRFPVIGNETVLDAVSRIGPLEELGNKHVWIARPAADCQGTDSVLPVNWHEVLRGSSADTNHQILSGDRIFVAEDRLTALDQTLDQFTLPFRQLLGLESLAPEECCPCQAEHCEKECELPAHDDSRSE